MNQYGLKQNKILSQSSYIKSQQDALFPNFILVKNSACFRQTYELSIVSSLNTVFTAIGICRTIYVDCLLARSRPRQQTVNITSMTNTYCCEYSIKSPDDGQYVSLSEICRVLYQNKVEKQCILLAFIIRIYHEAWSSECQICPSTSVFLCQQHSTKCSILHSSAMLHNLHK